MTVRRTWSPALSRSRGLGRTIGPLVALAAAATLAACGSSSTTSGSTSAGSTAAEPSSVESSSAGSPAAGSSSGVGSSGPSQAPAGSVPVGSTGASASGAAVSSDAQPAPGDTGAKMTMWVRAATEAFSKRLVNDYNSSHQNHVTLTIIPNDSYLQKVGAAAGSNNLADLLASDVVYSPNYVTQGLYQDLTEKVKALPFSASLVQAHLAASSTDGKIFAVSHKVDSSLIFINKDLFQKAGLDPNSPPKNFQDIYADAKKIRALGGDTYGFYFAGNCAGCNAYTAFPYAAAAGHPPLSADGKKADIDNDAFTQAFALYKKMFDEGIAPSSAKTEDGSTWTASFLAGKVGIYPAGSFLFADLLAKAKFSWGVTPLMSPDGSKTSTFVGGDVLGVSKSSKQTDAAWNFISWTLAEHAQVEDIAKNGDLPARTDLSGNKYTATDPRFKATVEGLANGYTPSALPYGELFNDATGPWNQSVRGAIFGSDPAKALKDAQSAIQAKLDEQ